MQRRPKFHAFHGLAGVSWLKRPGVEQAVQPDGLFDALAPLRLDDLFRLRRVRPGNCPGCLPPARSSVLNRSKNGPFFPGNRFCYQSSPKKVILGESLRFWPGQSLLGHFQKLLGSS